MVSRVFCNVPNVRFTVDFIIPGMAAMGKYQIWFKLIFRLESPVSKLGFVEDKSSKFGWKNSQGIEEICIRQVQ